ncbi:hypothetical protein GCM10010331_16400 [Streptomyces xanthochromogenes]|nr:hypothetical protein GCM10010331_16400 [Streptomyces xanthochromogenes]
MAEVLSAGLRVALSGEAEVVQVGDPDHGVVASLPRPAREGWRGPVRCKFLARLIGVWLAEPAVGTAGVSYRAPISGADAARLEQRAAGCA